MCAENINKSPINEGNNIYNCLAKNNKNEVPLFTAIRNGDIEQVNILLEIYEMDLKFIERSLNCDNKFWLRSNILIGYGNQNISTVGELYGEYCRVEIEPRIDKDKCVVILLKSDNFTPVNVLCLSPKSVNGKMITLQMVKTVYSNECLDINAKYNNEISLLCATAISGMINATIRLLQLGAEIDQLELASFAMTHGQIEYLDILYKRFGFKMYDIFISNEYFPKIFGHDNWSMFQYVVHAIMEEKRLSWRQIVNYNRVSLDSWHDDEHNTTFHFAIRNHHYKIAEHCMRYSDCLRTTSKCKLLPINEIDIGEQSHDLLEKMLEIDPAQLELFVEYDEDKYSYGIFHEIVLTSSFEEVINLFHKYPAVKGLFFKSQNISMKYLSKMLVAKKFDLVKYVLDNSFGITDQLWYEILNQIIANGNDNIELYRYVITMSSFNIARALIHQLNDFFREALFNRNYEICLILLLTVECDLNQIPIWRDNKNLARVFQDNAPNQIFNVLLQKRINFTKICDEEKNMLHHSVEANNLFATKKLLELDMDVNLYDQAGKLPIHYATTVDIFKLLNTWTSKSYINAKTKNGCTPLHLCCMSTVAGETINKLIRYILDNGGNIDARNEALQSPLFLVRDIERAKLILACKPNLNVVDKNGNTLINNFLTKNYNHEMFYFQFVDKSLQNLDPKYRKYVDENIFFLFGKCKRLVDEWLELPDINIFVYDNNKNSLLHKAIQVGNLGIIEKLIDKGISIEHRNRQNETPLLLMCDRLCFVRFNDLMRLLNYNPDVNVKNKYNKSPIWLVSQSRHDRNIVNIIMELLLRGANILDCQYPDRGTAYDNLSKELKKLFKFLV